MRKVDLNFKLVSVDNKLSLVVDIPGMEVVGWSIPKQRDDVETLSAFISSFMSGYYVGKVYSISEIYSIEITRNKVRSFKVYDHVERDLDGNTDYARYSIKPIVYKDILAIYLEELKKFQASNMFYQDLMARGGGFIKRELIV